jgi:hypothetical protein
MNLNDYIEKILKPRRDLYLNYARDAEVYKLEMSQMAWISMADDIDTTIHELQDLVLNFPTEPE